MQEVAHVPLFGLGKEEIRGRSRTNSINDAANEWLRGTTKISLRFTNHVEETLAPEVLERLARDEPYTTYIIPAVTSIPHRECKKCYYFPTSTQHFCSDERFVRRSSIEVYRKEHLCLKGDITKQRNHILFFHLTLLIFVCTLIKSKRITKHTITSVEFDVNENCSWAGILQISSFISFSARLLAPDIMITLVDLKQRAAWPRTNISPAVICQFRFISCSCLPHFVWTAGHIRRPPSCSTKFLHVWRVNFWFPLLKPH